MLTKIKTAYQKVISYNLAFVVPYFFMILLASATQVHDDPDIRFILENGKKILESGFPHTDWMSMHEELHIVIQQWVVSVVNYITFSNFGFIGIHILYTLVYFVYSLLLYKVCMKLSNNNYISSMFLTLFALLIQAATFGNARPQIFSVIFSVLAVWLMESYKDKKEDKLLLLMPLIALLQANFHSTFFIAIIGIYLTYLMSDILFNKKLDKKLAACFVLSIFVGLINPYGYEGILQPFYTRGYVLYTVVSELAPANTFCVGVVITLTVIAFASVIYNKNNNRKREDFLPIAFLALVTSTGVLLSLRLIMFYLPMMAFFISFLNRLEVSLEERKQLSLTKKDLFYKKLLAILGIIFIASTFYYGETKFKTEDVSNIETLVNTIKESGIETEDKTVLPPNIIEGQFLYHYTGMRPYIDGRLETYIDSLNHQHDYSTEYYNAIYSFSDEYKRKFIEVYDFDIVIATENNCSYFEIMNQLVEEGKYKRVLDSDIKNKSELSDKYVLYVKSNL